VRPSGLASPDARDRASRWIQADPYHARVEPSAENVASVVFAAAVVAAAVALGLAATARASRNVLVWIAGGLGAVAVGCWVAFALGPSARLAVAAGGATAAALVAGAALAVRHAIDQTRAVDAQLERARQELSAHVERELEASAVELRRMLAQARADSVSLLAQEERRIAEERRQEVAEREREANVQLSELLTTARQRLEQRLASWADDLERSQQSLAEDLKRLGEHQRQLMAQIEAKIERDVATLEGAAEEQTALAARLREELLRTTQEVSQAATAELDAHAAERRRALHEVAERLRRRERDLSALIEREGAAAAERVQLALADVERRQVEQLERVVKREAAQFAEAASQQFDIQIRSSREEAAKRLGRELDIAVERFTREAQSVIADRMLQLGNQGADTIDRRLQQLRKGLEEQRGELLAGVEDRLTELELQLRERVRHLASDAEAERLVFESRFQELARRVDDLLARAETRVR
jgi:hypothetical protein